MPAPAGLPLIQSADPAGVIGPQRPAARRNLNRQIKDPAKASGAGVRPGGEHPTSHTGRYLKQVLEQHPPEAVASGVGLAGLIQNG